MSPWRLSSSPKTPGAETYTEADTCEREVAVVGHVELLCIAATADGRTCVGGSVSFCDRSDLGWVSRVEPGMYDRGQPGKHRSCDETQQGQRDRAAHLAGAPLGDTCPSGRAGAALLLRSRSSSSPAGKFGAISRALRSVRRA